MGAIREMEREFLTELLVIEPGVTILNQKRVALV